MRSFPLDSGAEGRWTGEAGAAAVVCVNGGTAAEVPGTWSASVEWLVRALAPAFPALGFLEVRYRVKSWRRLELCVEDGAAAVAAARTRGARRILLLAFSMGGAVAVRNAGAAAVEAVVGVNPWLPPQLELEPLRGRRLAIAHGALDAPLPGIPGVKPAMSAAAAARARELGVEVERTLVPRAFHAVALRRRGGGLVALPGATRYRDLVGAELERFCA
ncbi:MAG TPA: alpha/beta fold hydrolase [Gaiellaceae bacterium]|nr:alpha/beta fold hydrolase [Gaiellaceae bacterium]